MIITIWRHGEAGEAAQDEARELTPPGERDVLAGAHALRSICERKGLAQPDQLWYSRWCRTEQTARIICEVFPAATSRSAVALIPGASPSRVEQALAGIWDARMAPKHLVLVSHQPLVSQLVDFFTGERGAVPHHPPGGLVTLSMESPSAVGAGLLFWAFPPLFEPST